MQPERSQIVEIIRQQILSMELPPGAVLDEVDLAENFGVSRTPLREAIRRLAGEGYLVLERNRGAKVAPMDLQTIRQFFQAAPMIYAATARLAAENASPHDIAELKSIQKEYRDAIAGKDAPATAMHNHRFHLQIGMMSGSPYLLPSLNRLLIDHTRIGQDFFRVANAHDASRIAEAAQQHERMIDAFERHAPTDAVEVTLEHWKLSRDQMERFVRADPLPHDLDGYSNAI